MLTDLAFVIALCSALLVPGQIRAEPQAEFAGGQACAECHKAQADLWRGSHHALAMQKATGATVLGDFAGATLENAGVVSSFSRSDGKFTVRTDGPDGALHAYEIVYTFGVLPLQQYLIAMPGGRLQAFGVAWDSRPKEQGGQRWFHLYPDQKLLPGNRLHWTGRDQTWNYQCAACHTTDFKKGYDLATDTYASTWSDGDVSCESCHGPGSRHIAWARSYSGAPANAAAPALPETDHLGLTNWLKPVDHGHWEMNRETGIARRTEPLVSAEHDTCAACHARRRPIAKNAAPGAPFLDSYAPAFLEPGYYHADGQIDGEVFEYGSFVQSRMYHNGVTCSNCHEPHSATLRAEGNKLCAQCHMAEKFDTADHTHHQTGSPGAQCIDCHMPTKTYMVVDRRRDHSFRVPRPDMTVSIGTPNACTQCHTDRSADWAARAIAAWYPQGRQTQPQYGMALQVGRVGGADAEQALDRLILDRDAPAIARGSALLLLPRFISPASAPAIKAAIGDPDALLRTAAPRAMPISPSRAIVASFAALLSDPVRAVRVEAARVLAGVDPDFMTPEQRSALATAEVELAASETIEADRPEAHLNLGLFDLSRGLPAETEAEYRTALRLDPAFVPAMVNLADLDRSRGMDQQGEEWLRKAVAIEPDNPDVQFSLGLLLVRQHNYGDALPLLRRASELAPDSDHYHYVYAIALNSTGETGQAIAILESAHRRNPSDRDVVIALISIERDKGDLAAALHYGQEWIDRYPTDMQVRIMMRAIEGRQPQ